MLISRKFIGSQEVVPGLRITSHPGQHQLAFTVTAVCVTADPEAWFGEVAFGGEVLLKTGETDDYMKATRAAEAALKAKVVEVFADR